MVRKLVLALLALGLAGTVGWADDGVDGRWSGTMHQSDTSGEVDYKILMQIEGDTGRTIYPDLQCAGELIPVADVDGYKIYSEIVTEGRVDPKTDQGCIDGLMVVQRHKDTLLVEWVGNYNGEPYAAIATLKPSKKKRLKDEGAQQ